MMFPHESHRDCTLVETRNRCTQEVPLGTETRYKIDYDDRYIIKEPQWGVSSLKGLPLLNVCVATNVLSLWD